MRNVVATVLCLVPAALMLSFGWTPALVAAVVLLAAAGYYGLRVEGRLRSRRW